MQTSDNHMRRRALKDGMDSLQFESRALNRFRVDADVDYLQRVEHVMSQIDAIGLQKKKGLKFTLISCPYHSEKTPSGRIQHDSSKPWLAGSFKCYGCNRTETWNNLAKDLGLEPFDNVVDPTRENFVLKGNLDDIEKKLLGTNDDEIEDDLKLFPITRSSIEKINMSVKEGWRGFGFKFLKSTGAKFCYSEKANRYYLYLPILVNGKEKGFIRAQLTKPALKSIPSYINAPGPWSLDFGLYPYDSAIQLMKSLGVYTIFLVEGPRDALRLLLKGYPAMALLGTHSWSETKLRMLQVSGARRLVTMFDGDAAGRKCTKLLTTGMAGNPEDPRKVAAPLKDFFETKIVRLWNIEEDPNDVVGDTKFDAGNLPDAMLDPILEKLCV